MNWYKITVDKNISSGCEKLQKSRDMLKEALCDLSKSGKPTMMGRSIKLDMDELIRELQK